MKFNISPGTLKFKIVDKWTECTQCHEYLRKFFYFHQCDSRFNLGKIMCYACCKKRGKCHNCLNRYTKMVKIRDVDDFFGGTAFKIKK